jgi:nitrite reductase/ring-hydroxylating ferredoxin subunit
MNFKIKTTRLLQTVLFSFLTLCFFAGCENSGFNNNNPYLQNYSFSIDINMDLPSFNALQFPSNAVRILQPGVGIRGIIVFNTGSGYRAYEAACPNQAVNTCSTMTINGIMAVCPCDNVEYNLFTGLGNNMPYPMKPYQIQQNGNTLRVFN